MARESKIRKAGLEKDVRILTAKGKTSREIAQILTERGLKISHNSVALFIREETEDRRQAAKAAAIKDANQTVPLVNKALKQSVVFNSDLASELYKRIKESLNDSSPAARRKQKSGLIAAAKAMASYSKTSFQAAKILYGVSVGDEEGDNVLSTLQNRLGEILNKKLD